MVLKATYFGLPPAIIQTTFHDDGVVVIYRSDCNVQPVFWKPHPGSCRNKFYYISIKITFKKDSNMTISPKTIFDLTISRCLGHVTWFQKVKVIFKWWTESLIIVTNYSWVIHYFPYYNTIQKVFWPNIPLPTLPPFCETLHQHSPTIIILRPSFINQQGLEISELKLRFHPMLIGCYLTLT